MLRGPATRPGKIRSFRDLDVWKRGMEIVADIYRNTRSFPKEELHGLVSQMRRAAVSVPSNVAGGFARLSNKDYRRFLLMSLGSCSELETQVEAGLLLGYVGKARRDELIEKLDHESRMLRNLAKRL